MGGYFERESSNVITVECYNCGLHYDIDTNYEQDNECPYCGGDNDGETIFERQTA